jgi:O-antigen biosynthesis protein
LVRRIAGREVLAHDLIRAILFGETDPVRMDRIRIGWTGPVEVSDFDIRAYLDDHALDAILAVDAPQVIVTIGAPEDYPRLLAAPLMVRRRWINVPDPAADPAEIADRILRAYAGSATAERFPQEPLVSVFTPTDLTGEKIERPRRSLLAQTYGNWEWVLYDDSPDEGETFARMSAIAAADHRVSAFRADRPCGNIGEVKRRACGLAKGRILLEFDHDDELTPGALRSLIDAANHYPEAGFFYSDCAEVFEDGKNASYGDDWGIGYGSYREEVHSGRTYLVTSRGKTRDAPAE